MRCFLLLLAFLLTPSAARAQFIVQQSSPAAGEVNVPLTDTVTFAFSGAVDLGNDWNTALAYEPRDSVRVGTVAICINFEGACGGGTDVNRYVRYTVQHQVDTDYTWFLYAVEAADGRVMAEPYVLRYTTAATIGQRTVEGTVEGTAAKQGGVWTPTVRATLRHLSTMLEQNGQGRPVFRRPASDNVFLKVSHASASEARVASTVGPHTRILLLDDFTVQEAAWDVRAGTVIAGASGDYQLGYVRPGTYWPLAVRYTDATHQEIEAIGFYDGDGDGTPDPITVGEEDLGAIDLTMYAFPLTTAKTSLAVARDSAAAYGPDQVLKMMVAGSGARPSGTAYVWTYTFYSLDLKRMTTVTVDPLGATVEAEPVPAFIETMRPIDEDAFVDSDAALQTIAEQGGEVFWGEVALRNLSTVIEGGNLYWRNAPDPERTFWRVQVRASTSSQTRVLEEYVDLSNGLIIRTDTETPRELPPARVEVAPSYPNPFDQVTHIPFTLAEAGPVRLTIYNMLGREVATLTEGRWLPAGTHVLTWEAAGYPAGVYVYRLQAGGQTRTRQLLYVPR